MSGQDLRSLTLARSGPRGTPAGMRAPFPRAGEVMVRQTFANDQLIHQAGGRHLLVVKMLSESERRSATDLGRSERIAFIPAMGGEQPARPIPTDVTLFEIHGAFFLRACRVEDLDLRAGPPLSNHKVLALAERTALLSLFGPENAVALSVMWVALARSLGAAFGRMPNRPDDAWLNPGALQRAVEFVETRIGGDLSVAAIAAVAGLSTSAFLRAFRGSVGMTPGDYVLERRTTVAADLLATTDLTITAISRRAGFRSSNHFSTTFTARRGLSPSQFRRSFRPVGQTAS